MNIHTILLIIIIIYLIFLNYKEKNIEKFAEIDDITAAVKEIYNTDFNHIRRLSKISKQMYNNNTLNINGDLIVDGDITCNDIIFLYNNDNNISTESSLSKTYDMLNKLDKEIINMDDVFNKIKPNIIDYTTKFKKKMTSNLPINLTYIDSQYSLITNPLDIKSLGITNKPLSNYYWHLYGHFPGYRSYGSV